jgi:hypothetical protein
MSKIMMHPPLSVANRLFLLFLFGMVMVIGGLIVVKKTPLQAQSYTAKSAVVVQIVDQSLSIQQQHPLPRHTQAKDATHH